MSNSRRLRRAAATAQTIRQHAEARSTGKLNAYRCPACYGYTVTIDVHEGVTPSFLACRAPQGEDAGTGQPIVCPGRAESMWYSDPSLWPDFHGKPIPEWEWHMPLGNAADKVRHTDPETWDHVRRGGLLLRRRGEQP